MTYYSDSVVVRKTWFGFTCASFVILAYVGLGQKQRHLFIKKSDLFGSTKWSLKKKILKKC